MPKETAKLINDTKKNGGRVICVGTTGCRTVESVFSFALNNDGDNLDYVFDGDKKKLLLPENTDFSGDTDIFIYPGYEFKCMDGLITNFHLPKSTLFMLVSAVAGLDRMQTAYAHAIKQKYRFYSYGDSSILKCVNKI